MFGAFYHRLRTNGYVAIIGQIVDETLLRRPGRVIRKKSRSQSKQARGPKWAAHKPAKAAQKDVDAGCTVKFEMKVVISRLAWMAGQHCSQLPVAVAPKRAFVKQGVQPDSTSHFTPAEDRTLAWAPQRRIGCFLTICHSWWQLKAGNPWGLPHSVWLRQSSMTDRIRGSTQLADNRRLFC